jgi:hypothetical protein
MLRVRGSVHAVETRAQAMTTQLLDPIPIPGIFVLFAVVTLATFEVGFRIGRWWQDRMPGEQEGPTDMLVGSILALMAFLLAITMGMAADRFDARRGMVLTEANAIGATYLQASYLPDPQAEQMRVMLREYLPLRIASDDDVLVRANIRRSMDLHAEMWAITAGVVRSGHSPDLMSAFGDSVTELVGISESRIVAGLYARVPETVLLLLLVGSALSLGMVGYNAGLAKRRSVLSAVVMVVALGAVLTLVVDLDRPQDGFINVSQQPLLDVGQWIGAQPG